MKKLIFTLMAIVMAIGVRAQNPQSPEPDTLTVTEVNVMANIMGLIRPQLDIRWVDEQGEGGVFTYNANEWFRNETFENVTNTYATLSGKYSIVPKFRDGVIEAILADGEKFLFKFKTEDTVYSVGVGTGSQFVVRRHPDGTITLLLEETVKLSPAPASDQ